jgi:hypothetical protein
MMSRLMVMMSVVFCFALKAAVTRVRIFCDATDSERAA